MAKCKCLYELTGTASALVFQLSILVIRNYLYYSPERKVR